MLNRSVESWHPCLILDSKHKDSGFLPGLLFVLKHFPPVPSLLRFFIKYTALCEKKFLHLPTKSYCFIIYSLLLWTNNWTDFHVLNHSGFLEIKSPGFFSFCCDSFHFVAGSIRCSFIGVLVGILATNSDLLFYRLYCLTLTWAGWHQPLEWMESAIVASVFGRFWRQLMLVIF